MKRFGRTQFRHYNTAILKVSTFCKIRQEIQATEKPADGKQAAEAFHILPRIEDVDKSKQCQADHSKQACKAPTTKPATAKNKNDSRGQKAKSTKGNEKKKVTLIPGEGVGPEICDAVVAVLNMAKAPIEWERFDDIIEKDDRGVKRISKALRESFIKNKVGLKGPMKGDDVSASRLLRRELKLFAFTMHCRNLGAYKTVYDPIDCVIIRDRTEGEYSGIEHECIPGILQTIKVATKVASKRLADYACEYARKHGRHKITVAHKVNIMPLTDGIFLNAIREAAEKHRETIQFEERFLDTVCHRLIMEPELNDVLVASSMYGDVMAAVAASVVGGLTMCSAYNFGRHGVLYDCAHSSFHDLVGQDVANPTALLLSAILMLRDMGFKEHANKVEKAVTQIYCDLKVLPQDLGGEASLTEFTKAICDQIECQKSANDDNKCY